MINPNKDKVRWGVILLEPNMDHKWWSDNVPNDNQKQHTWLKDTDSKVQLFATRKAAEEAGKVARDGLYHWRVQKYVKRETIA